jgi:hypothetical protein
MQKDQFGKYLDWSNMFNPIRRNRNIGTSSQGYGQQNKLTIPYPCAIAKSFYERLDQYEKTLVKINGHDFLFVVEQTRESCIHACSVNDLTRMIEYIPASDYGELGLIILRQPKRKEELLSPVWGRLIYSYEFEKQYTPAIIIEAIDYSKKLKWARKLSVEAQRELERLQSDGHQFILHDRHFIAGLKPENVRQTQLYRTLLHEFGHYVHYLEFVERQGTPHEAYEDREKRQDSYFKIAQADKEAFANRYTDKLRQELFDNKIIPFNSVPAQQQT